MHDRNHCPPSPPVYEPSFFDGAQLHHQLHEAPSRCFSDDLSIQIIDMDKSQTGLHESRCLYDLVCSTNYLRQLCMHLKAVHADNGGGEGDIRHHNTAYQGHASVIMFIGWR